MHTRKCNNGNIVFTIASTVFDVIARVSIPDSQQET